MSTWECRGCTAAYAPGAPRCPQCGVDDPIKEDEQLQRESEMAKVSVHNGASNAFTGEGMPEPTGPAEAGEEPGTGGREGSEQPEPVDYNDFTVEDLRAELKRRDLTATGNKPELVQRLAEDDGAKLQAGQESAE